MAGPAAFVVASVVALVGLHELVLHLSRTRHGAGVTFAITAIANYGLLVAIAFTLLLVHGVRIDNDTVDVDDAVTGSPADGKLASGDRIVSIDHVAVTGQAFRQIIDASAGRELDLLVGHDSAYRHVAITPVREGGHWILGVRRVRTTTVERHVGTAVVDALTAPARQLIGLTELVSSPTVELGGPARMVELFEPAFESLWWRASWKIVQLGALAMIIQLIVDVFRLRRSRTRIVRPDVNQPR